MQRGNRRVDVIQQCHTTAVSRRRQQFTHTKKSKKKRNTFLAILSLSGSLLGTIVACFAANGTTSTSTEKEMKINNRRRRRRSRTFFSTCTRLSRTGREGGRPLPPESLNFLFLYKRNYYYYFYYAMLYRLWPSLKYETDAKNLTTQSTAMFFSSFSIQKQQQRRGYF